MKVMAFNGSPRKSGNTATLLEAALAGAAAMGAETGIVHLCDLAFTGCRSCFACKLKGGKSYGRCAMRDGLTPILAEAAEADALVLGSPIYLAAVSSATKALMERLVFPYLVYDAIHSSLFPRKLPTGFIYTMNVTETVMVERGYRVHIDNNQEFLARVFGACETLCCFDTYQFDYDKYVCDGFDAVHKADRHRDVFPADCKTAFALGERLVIAALPL